MALSDILEKIQSEAEAKADELKAEFDAKKKTMQSQNLDTVRQMEEENERLTLAESTKMKEKAQMEAEMEAKNALLRAKRELMEDTLHKAIEALSSAERYEDLLVEMMNRSDLESGVVISAKGKEEATKKAIGKSGKKYQLADEAANIKGGFILKSEKIEIDNSFETVIAGQLRQPLEIELNKLLFA